MTQTAHVFQKPFATQRFQVQALHSIDSYKGAHVYMFPEETEFVTANYTPRSDRLSGIPEEFNNHKLTWVGLQGVLLEFHLMWKETFFDHDEDEVIAQYEARMAPFGGQPNRSQQIRALHKLGYLPLNIKALPEGSLVNMGVPVFTVVNTVKGFGWLSERIETNLSQNVWKATTIATIATAYKTLLTKYAVETGTPLEFVDWQGHCFADRGMSGEQDAAKSLSGHSLSFLGSDSVSTVDWLEFAYGAAGTFVAGSVPATEHSVTTLNLGLFEKQLEAIGFTGDKRLEAEYMFIERLLNMYPTGVLSHVADSNDLFRVITELLPRLKDKIMARKLDANGLAKLVIRPDSGDPVKIICGYKVFNVTYAPLSGATKDWLTKVCAESNSDAYSINGKVYELASGRELSPAEAKGVIECLWDIFGGTTTDKGFRQLDAHIGSIYGDSINLTRAVAIMEGLKAKKFASGNIVFGIGSFTYNFLTRDNFGFAMKATAGIVEGELIEIYKDPVTDVGKAKKSAKGLLRVEKVGTDYVLHDRQTPEQEATGELKSVYLEGAFHNFQDWTKIKSRYIANLMALGAIPLNESAIGYPVATEEANSPFFPTIAEAA